MRAFELKFDLGAALSRKKKFLACARKLVFSDFGKQAEKAEKAEKMGDWQSVARAIAPTSR